MSTQFIIDAEGNKIAVIIPIEEYTRLLKNSRISDSYLVSENEQVYKKNTSLDSKQEEELINRYNYVLKNPSEGKTWEEIEKKLTE